MSKASSTSAAVTGVFRYTTGAELSSPERRMLRAQNAGVALVSALESEPSWWAHVETVRSSQDPLKRADELSKRYAARRRRRPFAVLLLACAEQPDRKSASQSMCGLLTAASFVPDEAGRRSTYALGGSYMIALLRGAREVAARGSSSPVSLLAGADEDVRRLLDLAGPLILSAAERRAAHTS